MRYLGLALYAEGSTDYRFLSPLLTRVVEDVLLESASSALDIGPMIELREPAAFRSEIRATKILEAARAMVGGFHILFVHADADGDPERARREQADPGIAGFLAEFSEGYAGVAVVPVREMEAWAIADGDALRAAFGTTLSDGQLGIPTRARDVERNADPKRILEQAYARVLGGAPRGPGKTAAGFLDLLGQTVGLDRLGRLDAFRQLREDVTDALRTLNAIR
jgi:hypothetical protein